MVRKIENLVIFLLLAMSVTGNNIRSASTVEIVSVSNDTALLQFDLQWDNSWRDAYNWDTAWIFLKYKEAGGDWQPVYLGESGHSFSGNYSCMPGKSGANVVGFYVYRSTMEAGNVSTTCRLKWKLPAGLTQEKFKTNKAFIMAQGVEMVLVPYGAYYLGDGASKNSFRSIQQRIIPAEDDLIGTDPKFTYSCIPMPYYRNAAPIGAADRVNNAVWTDACSNVSHISVGNHLAAVAACNTSWTVNFKEQKIIRCFGVSASTQAYANGNYLPTKDWFLLGSNDSLRWDTLTHCRPSEMIKDPVSYPIRHAIRVTKPGAYQYYRLFFLEMNNGANGFMLANVAMSEKNLYPSDAYPVDSEEKITFGKGLGQLHMDGGTTWTGEMPVNYPKGYKGFYIMKYELSQEQYVAFLNTLTFAQQAERVPGLAAMKQGDYIFGDRTKPNNRNGIIVNVPSTSTSPVLFANNLNNDTKYNQPDDGKTIACNYMTPEDLHTYCAWSGLRPMSELEYEKASRTPYPEIPKAGEYAWNDNATPVKAPAITNGGAIFERPASGVVNAGSLLEGPIRSGSFAKSGSSQVQAGATYWGVMEMSGNVKELCVNATGTLDGSTTGSGIYNKAVSGWSSTPAQYGVRGGGFSSTDEQLRTSDRTAMTVSMDRDSTVGFRGVGVLNASTLSGGTLTVSPTGCAGVPLEITGTMVASTTPVNYQWYVKVGSGAYELIAGETGQNLTYNQFVNTTASAINYTFQRKAFSAIGEGWSNEPNVSVTNAAIKFTPTSTMIDACGNTTPVTASPAMSGVSPTYTWSYNGSAIPGVSGATYTPSIGHFGGNTGDLKVTCTAMINDCSGSDELTVSVPVITLVASSAVTMVNCGSVVFYDDRDGARKTYCTVKIGNQCWMGVNLNVGTFTQIITGGGATSANTWTFDEAGIQKWCIGGAGNNISTSNESNCAIYGGLYEWWEMVCGGQCNGSVTPANAQSLTISNNEAGLAVYGAKMVPGNNNLVQGICPDGWHIPTDAEWGILGSNKAGWGAKLGGYRTPNGNGFYYLGSDGYWWSSTPYSSPDAWCRYLGSEAVGTALNQSYCTRSGGLSVRCLRN